MDILGVIRLSHETEVSTSPERQKDAIQRNANEHGHRIVGWATDIGVSASVAPADRPSLGPWLKGDHGKFDAIVVWRLDRVARRVLHLATLMDQARREGWTIVSTSESFDLGTPFGRIIANIIGALAEGELEAIRERVHASRAHLAQVGRYAGRTPVPLGYRIAPNPSGAGKVLVPDEDGSRPIVDEIVRRVLEGESLSRIATDLTRRGIPTARGWARVHQGKEAGDTAWTHLTLRRVLRGETLRGYSDPPVYDDAMRKVRRAEPLIDAVTFDRLQAMLDARETEAVRRDRSEAATWLPGALVCAACGRRYQVGVSERDGIRMRCGSASHGVRRSCGNGGVAAAVVEEMAEAELLAELADTELTKPVYLAGESHRDEIAEAEQAVARLVARLEAVAPGEAAERAILARLAEHDKHLAALRELPEHPSSVEFEPTGETWGERWHRSDTAERRALLAETGVSLVLQKESRRPPALRVLIGSPHVPGNEPPLDDPEAWRVFSAA